ncbi:MAG: hypothetical protein V2J55_14405 [Candidatus Competibacteraceae bacterium]|jgi:hypothetical protein|nr:hypothetical protein [Candidatus Competibacteraceae bacterium]
MNDSFQFVVLAARPCRRKELFGLSNLIDSVNALQPPFVLHVGGDTAACVAKSEKRLRKIIAFFNQFHCPVIFTPGEREWVDAEDAFDCLERARSLFWGTSVHLENTLSAFSQQAAQGDHKQMQENVLWMHGCVLFLTLHTVGCNNNLGRGKAFNSDFSYRNKANLDWLDVGFSVALENRLEGVVICTHADPWRGNGNNAGNGFRQILTSIRRWSKRFTGRVLVIHGEQDGLLLDQPLTIGQHSKRVLENMIRLRVPGRAGQGVVVNADPAMPDLFSISTLTAINSVFSTYDRTTLRDAPVDILRHTTGVPVSWG